MENLYKKTKDIMRKYNISANKSLGQNFLINEEVVENIVNSSNITEKDLVIEIGPGLGTLTEHLLEKAGKVIAIELDNRMLEILNQRFYQYTNFEIINQDVLKVDLNSIINNEKNYNNFDNVKIVANLPYYITTPIVMKLLEEKLDIQSITVMIQKEVAQRLIATPGDKLTGAITYCVYYYAESESIMTVPNSSFIPEPEVESQVIKLNIRKKPPVRIENEELFFRVIKTSFMQRRKTLINSLANGGLVKNKEEFKQVLNKMELDSNVRGETLTIEQFAIITQELS
ncbi:MAG TPA: 16S rRNA (adenine(1518)-N(6)/adenine(1519)-N(6))-dimethyltransferase RsmA [Clostridia bacterium]|nr:16S rRNA (adenine(1518)-N(6)/adenine(1519)-N(6))-dimethyltransferase RsmA [Clostridia bacterium]